MEKKTIGIISPSFFAPGMFPDRFKRGVESLKKYGYEVIVAKNAEKINPSAIERAEDINNMYANKDVSIIVASIGGSTSKETLPYIDFDLIKKNKKPLVGYSDITTLLLAIGVKTGSPVYYGPTIMTEFSEYPGPIEYSMEKFNLALSNSKYNVSPVDTLYETGSDWALPPKKRRLNCQVFAKTIQGGICKGQVVGGCIEVLDELLDTEYFPSTNNAILVLETSIDEYSMDKWNDFLDKMAKRNLLNSIQGVVIGQKKWNEEEVNSLVSVLKKHFSSMIPILYGLPFGHISPIATLKLFQEASLDTDNKILKY